MKLFELMGIIAINNAKANKAIDSTVGKAIGASSVFVKVGKKIAGVGVAIGTVATAVGGFAVKAASEYETNFAKVSTLLTGSEEDIRKYKEKLLEASSETGVAAGEMSEAVYSAISASVNQDDAIEFAKRASELAKGGFTETETAVDIMTTAINAYKMEAKDASKVSDMLITTQNLGKTTVDELASSMGKIIPTANSYGVKMDVLCGMYAEMTKNGIATAESTTYMNGMLNELGKSGTIASNILKEKTGKSFKELMDSGMSLTDILGILEDEAKNSGKSMGDMFGSAEAGKAATVLSSNAKDLNKNIKAMGKSSGETKKAATKMADTVNAKVKKLKTQVTNAMIKIGNKVLPVIEKIFDSVKKVMPAINKKLASVLPTLEDIGKAALPLVRKGFKLLTSTVVGTVNALGKVINFLKKHEKLAGALAGAIGGLVGAMVTYKAVTVAQQVIDKANLFITQLQIAKLALQEGATLKAALAQAELNTAMNMNPAMLLITGIGLLVGSLVGLALATDSDTESTNFSTEAHKKKMEAIQAEMDAINQANEQTATTNAHIMSEYTKYEVLADRLDKLVDKQGKVRKGKEGQVQVILDQLNPALDLELEMVNGQVKGYEKVGKNIDKLIEKKRVEAFLNTKYAEYKDAVSKMGGAVKALNSAQSAYNDALGKQESKQEKINKVTKEQEELEKKKQKALKENDQATLVSIEDKMLKNQKWLESANVEIERLKKNTTKKKNEYDKQKNIVKGYTEDIIQYEAAAAAAADGNSKKAQKILLTDTSKFGKIGTEVMNGYVGGMTTEEVFEAIDKGSEKVSNYTIKQLKKHLDINSPSRVARDQVGIYIPMGVAEGIGKATHTVVNAAKKLADNLEKALKATLGSEKFKKYGEAIADKLEKGFESRINSFKNKVDRIKDKMNTALNELASKRDSFKEKLSQTDLFTKGDNGEITLTGFAKQIKDIKKYQNNINKLKRKLSDNLMSKIVDMDSEDGLAFTNKLLSLSSADLEKYNKDYSKLLSTSGKIANNYYAKDMALVKDKGENATVEAIKDLKKSLAKIMTEVLTKNVKIKIDEREIARVVRKYA